MNAKKIMGVVLVALLAAALLVGAGAAATVNNGTYFAFQKDAAGVNGVWMNGDNKVTVTGGAVSAVPVAGTYTLGDFSAYFTNPTVTYAAYGNLSGTEYIVNNGGLLYAGSNLTLAISSLNTTIVPNKLQVTGPNGAIQLVATSTYADPGVKFNDAGVYKIQAIWTDASAGLFTTGAPLPIYDANVFTFTVVKPEDATITGSVDTVYAGETVAVTIKGTPGVDYELNLTGFNAPVLEQIVTLNNITHPYNFYFSMPSAAEVTLQFTTQSGWDEDEVKVTLIKNNTNTVIDEVVVAIAQPELTVTLGEKSYFIGDEIKVIGTSNVNLPTNGTYKFNITGTNFAEVEITPNYGNTDFKYEAKEFTIFLPTLGVKDAKDKKLDVGTYTIKMYDSSKLVKTLSVALKQPFISIADAPEVVVQGEKAEFVINAEAAKNITAYVFGTNFFKAAGFVDADEDVSNQFTVKIDGKDTNNMSTGQYFAVFQHPMYDQYYNILGNATGDFFLNTKATADNYAGATDTFLFSAKDRQTANAAQALCDALESQNIDDMYVKASFFVVGEDESFTISEIPTTIAQGETLTISGVSTANAGNEVTVEMISTAFAAVPKETVGSAAFILVTTEVAEDGSWEITLDTSDLNVDEYSLKVAVTKDGKSETWKNVNINVVEGADTPDTPDTPDVPDTPDTPDTPTEPTTPGFGALAALAGLGAVAVLLLRRE